MLLNVMCYFFLRHGVVIIVTLIVRWASRVCASDAGWWDQSITTDDRLCCHSFITSQCTGSCSFTYRCQTHTQLHFSTSQLKQAKSLKLSLGSPAPITNMCPISRHIHQDCPRHSVSLDSVKLLDKDLMVWTQRKRGNSHLDAPRHCSHATVWHMLAAGDHGRSSYW